MSINKNMRWFADDFDYRVNRDDCAELMRNGDITDGLPPLSRMLVESNEWFVELTDAGRVCKAIRKRDDENLPYVELDPEDMDPEDRELREAASEDAMNHAKDAGSGVPKPKWDLVFWTEKKYRMIQLENVTNPEDTLGMSAKRKRAYEALPPTWYDTDVIVSDQTDPVYLIEKDSGCRSIPHFLTRRDKRLRGYAKNLEKAVERGISARGLIRAVGDARKADKISGIAAKRLWELWKIKRFLAKKLQSK